MNDVQQTAVHRRLLAQGGVDLSQRRNAELEFPSVLRILEDEKRVIEPLDLII